jgi:phenylalanyl-tRNA synthetase beta chain
MRPINNIVDITNYVMLEMGQPLHAFDYDLLKERAEGRQPMIRVRRAQSGERMTTLDGVEHEFDDQMLLITDAKGPVAIAGIMGGTETEVSSTTKRILLESANFEFLNNRRTCQLLKLRTEASERFGKRLDPELTLKAAVRAARLMEEYAGGFLNSAYGDLYLKKRESIEIELDPLYVNRLLGVDLSRGEIVKILERLAFQVVVRDKLQVTVPSHRMDVRLAADLVEEVARVYGYNRMPGTLMDDALPKTRPSASQRNAQLSGTEKVRDIIVETGLDEIITYSIVDPQDEARLVPDEQKRGWELSRYLALQNPLSAERTHMRQSLIPGALTTTKRNLRFKERVAVFEIGNIYQPREGELLPDEIPYLTILMTGKRLPPSWLDGAINSQSPCPPLQKEGVSQSEYEDKLDFYDLKGVLVTLMEGLHIRKTSWQKNEGGIFHPGQSAAIMIEGEILGQMGEIHPKVVRCFGLPEQPVCVAEFELKALLRHWNQVHMMIEMPIYAPIYEDLAFVVDESIPAGQVESLILQTGHPLLEKVHLFDVFRGKRVGSNKKSLAFSMTYQAFDRTLTDEDVEPIREKIIRQLKQELNAELRV